MFNLSGLDFKSTQNFKRDYSINTKYSSTDYSINILLSVIFAGERNIYFPMWSKYKNLPCRSWISDEHQVLYMTLQGTFHPGLLSNGHLR